MPTHAASSFTVKSWDEKPYDEPEGQPKLTRAEVVFTYHGNLEAEGHVIYLMCYSSNGIAYYTGQERVTGRLGERTGSFVLQHVGTFEDGVAQATVTVVPGSATGELSGLIGSGRSVAGHEPPAEFTLDYDFA